MELLISIYQQSGVEGLLGLAFGVGTFGGVVVALMIGRAYAHRQNARSRDLEAAAVAVETNAALARDSTLGLRAINEAYHALQETVGSCRRENDLLKQLVADMNEDIKQMQDVIAQKSKTKE